MYSNLNDRVKRPLDFNGIYRGEVVSNNDPLKAGRVRVRVFSVYDNVPDDHLPWALYSDPLMGGSSRAGSLFVPVVGSHVWVFFENSNHMHPVYFAGAPAMVDGEPDAPIESRENGTYPHNKVIRTEGGIVIEFDDTEGSIRYKVTHPSGTTIEIGNDGSYTVNLASDSSMDVDGDGSINLSGNLSINVSGNAEISVSGNTSVDSSGNTQVSSGGQVQISGATISLN